MKRILITGGSGFIGSAMIRHLIKETNYKVCNIDKLTYASDNSALLEIEKSEKYEFHQIDICDKNDLQKILNIFRPNIVMHLAAESHVDNSISSPLEFINTNILGTYNLLQISKEYFKSLDESSQKNFIFHHISTDEVYGDLENDGTLFNENTRYAPSSPYSASKAASDHLVRAWQRTYDLPTIVTNCSNNYGPFQFPEKLIPKTIINALQNKKIPIYGSGNQIRDWLFVNDHVEALLLTAENAKIGSTYNIGGFNEKRNIEVVNTICEILDDLSPSNSLESYKDLITFIGDRPGHDKRYAIDSNKILNDLDWHPDETFDSGIRKTVEWYLKSYDWRTAITKKS
jgi:dTDP-glucose 4,6-dehydratase